MKAQRLIPFDVRNRETGKLIIVIAADNLGAAKRAADIWVKDGPDESAPLFVCRNDYFHGEVN
jgi:hypothetical protein